MSSCRSLGEILEQIDESDSSALIFDGFDGPDNGCISYRQLKNIFKLYGENIFKNIKNFKENFLIAFYVKDWNKNFYELFLSSIYCGFPYFIVDSRWPKDYCNSSIERVKPDLIITDDPLNMSFEEINCYENTNYRIFLTKYLNEKPQDLSYVITTSGTTGKPKVIEVCNSSIIPNIYDLRDILSLNSMDLIYQASSLTFDPSLIEIFCSFVSKCKLLILPQNVKQRPEILNNYLFKHHITTLQVTPTLFKVIDSKILEEDTFKNLILGGEKFPIDKRIKDLIINEKNVFNIYGLTELSCWSSCHRVQLHDLDYFDGVPIGSPMSGTKLFVKVKGEFNTVPFSDLQGEYELFHSSEIRKCYINGINEKIIQSGDLVLLKNSQVFLKGRIDRLVKINANLVDLEMIESTLRSKWTHLIFSAFLLKENYLVVSVFYELKSNEIDLKTKIRNFLLEKFPFYYEPRKIMALDKQCLPFTIHGKLDYAKLKDLAIEKDDNEKIPLENLNALTLLKNLWKEKLGSEPDNKTNFIKAGGNSLKALFFAEEIKEHLEKSSIFLDNNLLLDTILNQTFEQILKLIERPNSNQKINFVEPKSSKKIKLDSDNVDSRFYLNSNIVCCLSKSFSFLKINLGSLSKNKPVFVNPVWKIDTAKCVDATPLIVGSAWENGLKNRVYIGSHSGKFICVDALNGVLKWDFEALDRIESSSCLDKTGSFVLFGSYDNCLYVLNAEDGLLHWKLETGDFIKSSPCIDYEKGYAYFGSYDKHIYCVNIQKKAIVWKKNLDKSSIFSGPTCDSQHNVYVSTLAGNLYSLDKNCGQVNWIYSLDKATFTSPIIDTNNCLILLGTCGGTFYCIDLSGNLQWKFEVEKPIFTNACLVDDLVLFGCHDHFFYCLSIKDGTLKWKFFCENEIYSSPFYDQRTKFIMCINCDSKMFLFDKNGLAQYKKIIFNTKNSCYSSPLIWNNKIYIGSRDNYLHCFDLYENC